MLVLDYVQQRSNVTASELNEGSVGPIREDVSINNAP